MTAGNEVYKFINHYKPVINTSDTRQYRRNKMWPLKSWKNTISQLIVTIDLQFEEEQFENVPDLITFYQAHNKPITRNSGCIIKNPVPNTTFVTRNFEPQLEIDQNYMKILRSKVFKSGKILPP